MTLDSSFVRTLAGLALLSALASCGDSVEQGLTGIRVTVTFDATLGVDQLMFSDRSGGSEAFPPVTRPANAGALDPGGEDLVILLNENTDGDTVTVRVDGTSAGTAVGVDEKDVVIVAGSIEQVTLALVACGAGGEICCSGNTCVDSGTACGPGNTCQPCGGLNEICCAGNACTDGGTTCAGGMCESCGGAGEACCAGDACDSGCCDTTSSMCIVEGGACALGPCTSGVCEICGFPGEPCCAGDTCNGGGCCDSGNCVASGSDLLDGSLCSAGASAPCGADGESCCANSSCDNATSCCVAGTCVASGQTCGGSYGTCNSAECQGGAGGDCGAAGGDCCDGNPNGNGTANNFCTQSGQACNPDRNECQACGGPDQVCCEGVVCNAGGCCDQDPNFPTCVASGADCADGDDGVCQSGGCEGGTCGLVGQAECTNSDCTGPFTDNTNDSCVPCGGLGQRCCDSTSGKYCGSPYVCDGGTCAQCGAIGQSCCQGDLCAVGTCSAASNICQ